MTTENISSATSGQSTFAIGFTVPTDTSEIQVYVENASTGAMTLQTAGNHYNIVGTNVVFTSGNEPAAGTENVQILRNTDVASTTKHRTFVAGSSIRAADLNANFTRLFDHGEDKIQTSDIASQAVTNGKIAKYTITTNRIAANAVETGRIADSAVTESKIADLAVSTSKLKNLNVTEGKLADSAVTTDKIASQAVTTAKITDNAVTTAKIADNAVTTAKIAAGAIVNSDVNASAAIAGTKISPDFGSQDVTTSGTITTTGNDITVQGNSPRLTFIDNNADDYYIEANGNNLSIRHFDSNVGGSTPPERLRIEPSSTKIKNNLDAESGVDVTGNITVTGTVDGRDVAADGTKLDGIATNADVTSSKNIGDLANVNTSGVADGKILKYQASSSSFIIADDTGGGGGSSTFTGLSDTPTNFTSSANKVLTVNSAGNAIEFTNLVAGNLADSAVTTAKLASSAVTSAKISNSAVITIKLNDLAVTTAKIANTAITEAKIANNAVTGTKLADIIDLVDNNKIRFGSGNDLEIYHDGTDSFITNTTGNLLIRPKSGEEGIKVIPDGAVELYHDNVKKAETTADGFEVSKDIKITAVSANDFESGRVRFVESNANFNGGYIHYDGSGNKLKLGVHPFNDSTVGNDVNCIVIDRDSKNVELYYDGTKKFETTSTGAKMEGGGSKQLHLINTNTTGANHVILGLRSYSGDGDTKISFGTSADDNPGEIKYISDLNKFLIRVNGSNTYTVTSTEIQPNSDNAVALGTSTKRFSTLHSAALNTGDIHMNNLNESSGNEVDGTKGSWSLQEGADDLFLINRVSGKKYKFNITEIN